MLKKIAVLIFSGLFLLSLSGCWFLIGGAAGGAGTAVWLGGKLTQEFSASYERTASAAEKALNSLSLKIKHKTSTDKVTQLRSEYTDGKEIWVDVRKITDSSSKVEVRVGAVSPDKVAAEKILKRIQDYL
ncbi:MAG: DUF3568 domain-containing protein [Candidatus Omnitrophica bacterium]|nr:DUF3568 domain-containing protein [Candidatus Omnitrophota bacterium]